MTRLPATLAPWEESLAQLHPRVAVVLGPMLHVLDELIGRLDDPGGSSGEPDGYDGTTNRGDVGRLLMDEWLLAQELPWEFLRRAAENELTFLRPAHRRAASHGRVVVVIDTGPEQLGVGRLVQLAALVVLDRRARASGSELVVQILQSETTFQGELAELVTHWLSARSVVDPTPAQLEAAFAAADRQDRIWLVGGSATLAPGHRRTIYSWVTGWQEAGASDVTVRVGNSTARLRVPDPPAAVAALRGEGLLARRSDPTLVRVPTTGQGAVFNSADARLLWRGSAPEEVYGCFVAPGHPVKVRRYRMDGHVLAAASLGKRLVAALTDGAGLWIQVVGKKLSRTDQIHLPISAVGLDQQSINDILDQPLKPLYLHGGQILLPTPSGWWSLGDTAAEMSLLAVAPGSALDNPRTAYPRHDGFGVGSHHWRVTALADGPLLGPLDGGSWCAWTEDTRVWRIARSRDVLEEIGVGEDDHVVGLCVIQHSPALIVTSPSGRIVRQVSPRGIKTWTRWAGPAHFSVHPGRPWLARSTTDRITVGDLSNGQTVLEVRTAE